MATGLDVPWISQRCRFFGHVAASGLGGADEYLTEVWEQLKALENEYLRVDLMVEIIMSQVPR